MEISYDQIDAYHAALLPPMTVATRQDCLQAVNRLGFAWAFTPHKSLLPAFFPAIATESEYQRWDWMWDWKDQLSASGQAFYGKVVAAKPTLVSLEWLAVMYALSGNTGDLEDDLARLAEEHRVPDLAMKVCRFLAENGPTDTRVLQAKLTDESKPMKRSLEQALAFLDRTLLITKAGAKGGNSLANRWALLSQHLPQAVEAGTELPSREAAPMLLRKLFALTPAVTERALYRFFPWNEAAQRNAITRLMEAGELVAALVGGKPGLARRDFMTGS